MVPTISIGLAVYNGDEYLEESIESLLAQTRDDFELLISDNHSTDRTAEICERFARSDRRVRYTRNAANVGAAENYNRVFRQAAGKYFKWAAHDDVCAPGFLERCTAVLEDDPSVVLCYPRTTFIDEASRSLGLYEETDEFTDPRASARLRTWLFERSGAWCNAVFGVMRSDVLRMTPLIGKYSSSDVILLGELLMRGRMVRYPEPLFFRRDHPGRSVRAHADGEARAVWFDPSAAGRVQMPVWRWLMGYSSAVARVPMSAVEKCRCGILVARWAATQRRKLKDELLRRPGKNVAGRARRV